MNDRRLVDPLVCLAIVVVAGCGNPAVDSRIEALGDEDPDVAASEFHRPGQPCVLCHGPYEGATPEISVGGTVFAKPNERIPVKGATVVITDSKGEFKKTETNCIGNFFWKKEDWDPYFPLHVEIEYPVPPDGTTKKASVMSSRIARDGSCAGCHVDKDPGQDSPGRVWCTDDVALKFEPPDASCLGKIR
jgi:hypothetical protein